MVVENLKNEKRACVSRAEPRSDLKSERTRSAFAAAEWKAVLALETKEGASISYGSGARIKAYSVTLYRSRVQD